MSNFRPYRGGHDRGGSGGHYRADNIKAAPPPPVGIGSASARSSDRHYNERHRSRSPIHFRHDAIPPPVPQHQQQVSSTRAARPDERSQHTSSSRRQDLPPPQVTTRFQDHSSSRDTSSRHAEPTKRTPASSSKRTPSPHSSTRKPASSSTSKSSKSKTLSTSHSQTSSAEPGHSSKSSRSSAPDANLHSSSRTTSIITKNTEVLIVREILNANEVKIPRRAGEGAWPIFDRDELRESIQRRTKGGDREQNPVSEQIEQRVVAIIREPVLIDSYATSSSRKHSSQTDLRHRARSPDVHTTTSGVTYRLNASSPPSAQYASRRSRSLSPVRPPAPPERERERLDKDRKRDYRGHDQVNVVNFAGESSRSAVNQSRRDRSRSRSRSPADRIRRVTLNSSSASAPLNAYGNRISGERDLRESLSRAPKVELPVPRDVEARDSFRGRGFTRGGYFRRPRGGFSSRGRAFARRLEPRWQHDKFDRSGGDPKSPM